MFHSLTVVLLFLGSLALETSFLGSLALESSFLGPVALESSFLGPVALVHFFFIQFNSREHTNNNAPVVRFSDPINNADPAPANAML